MNPNPLLWLLLQNTRIGIERTGWLMNGESPSCLRPNNFLCREEHKQEAARLINKLGRNIMTSGQSRDFKSRHIWITAENPDCIVHEWHRNYSSLLTEVLGKLGCRTSSNLLGIREAEWHWKLTKLNKGGQRADLGTE